MNESVVICGYSISVERLAQHFLESFGYSSGEIDKPSGSLCCPPVASRENPVEIRPLTAVVIGHRVPHVHTGSDFVSAGDGVAASFVTPSHPLL